MGEDGIFVESGYDHGNGMTVVLRVDRILSDQSCGLNAIGFLRRVVLCCEVFENDPYAKEAA